MLGISNIGGKKLFGLKREDDNKDKGIQEKEGIDSGRAGCGSGG